MIETIQRALTTSKEIAQRAGHRLKDNTGARRRNLNCRHSTELRKSRAPLKSDKFSFVLKAQREQPNARINPPRRDAELKQVSRMKAMLFAVGFNELLGRTLDVSIQPANFFNVLSQNQLDCL